MSEHITEIIIFTVLFLVVSAMGFIAARWRAPQDMAHLDEWGLGGRSFGGWVTWFLIGGDLYTAYTFVAVPALVFGVGALGFFAVPYTIVVYPIVFAPGSSRNGRAVSTKTQFGFDAAGPMKLSMRSCCQPYEPAPAACRPAGKNGDALSRSCTCG